MFSRFLVYLFLSAIDAIRNPWRYRTTDLLRHIVAGGKSESSDLPFSQFFDNDKIDAFLDIQISVGGCQGCSKANLSEDFDLS